jgi:Tfp pilus assembly protein FimT
MSLEKSPEDASPARRSWWRRMTDRENQPVPYAGQRPRLRRGPGQLVRLLITLLVVVLIAIFAGIFGPGAVGAIEDHFVTPHFEQVASVTSSTDGITNGPSNLTDQWSNTWWGSGGSVAGAFLDVTFASPVHLLDVIITPGAGATEQEFQTQDSPQSLTFTMTSTGGQQTTQVIHLNGSNGAQTFTLHASGVTKAHIVVGAAFPAGNSAGGSDQQIAISGIEFFGR